ncbi:Ribosomal protein L13 family protein isoform 1 [Hibiscus syriacus]|uniref:Pectinesterase n=1 Tax=Hibiscus syriacus TaxID=106335 RepID=A0A6A3A4J7_HIBSY|nr:Ribosomal protein L13 family protein isoform 1 [Hibiscus syriacus]
MPLSSLRSIVVSLIVVCVIGSPIVMNLGFEFTEDAILGSDFVVTSSEKRCLWFDLTSACKTVRVDQSGHADFSTIQSAIDSVPSNNADWYCINVNPGTYREKVQIPRDKPFILLKGSGQIKTMVVWNEPYLHDATFSSFADNIIVTSLSFINSYWGPERRHAKAPAVAAMVNGDKSFFFRCGFSGVQDTLFDSIGRHYFKECYIRGAVDFIFGNGQSIYEDCSIHYLGGDVAAGACRAWRDFSRVLFYNCNFSNVVYPLGWNAWRRVGKEQQFTFAEHKNFGPGADTSKRVKWMKNLDPQTVAKLTSMSFIDSDGWRQSMPLQPVISGQPDPMRLLSWNVQGFGRPRTVRCVQHALRDVNPSVVFLMETKLPSSRMVRVRCKCGFRNGIDVDATGSIGGLSLAWREATDRCGIFVWLLVTVVSKMWVIRVYGSHGSELKQTFGNGWIWVLQILPVICWKIVGSGTSSLRRHGCLRSPVKQKLASYRVLHQALYLDLLEMFPNDEVLDAIMETKLHLNMEEDKEEIFWEQRARVIAIEECARNYFQELFPSNNNMVENEVLEDIRPCISPEMNMRLARAFTPEDVYAVVKTIGPLNASGEDGLGAIFYQRFWHIISTKVSYFCIGLKASLFSFEGLSDWRV